MLEFLFNHNSIITHSIEAIAAIIGLLYLKKYKGTPTVFFVGILVYLCLIDTLGSFPKYYDTFDFLSPIKNSRFYKNNWWFTVFFDIIAVLLFCLFYLKILKKRRHRLIIKYLASIYLVYAIFTIYTNFDLFLIAGLPKLYIFSGILIILCAVFYFIEIIETDKILDFYKLIYFYISFAIFIWWLVITPLVFYDRYYILTDRDFMILKRSIYIFANLFMYTTFAIGFLISKPERLND